MTPEQKKALAEELSDLLNDLPPQPVEVVAVTGEMFTSKALRLARLYDAATNGQRDALDQICAAFEKCPPKQRKR